jgi:hypothetical protein
MVADIAIRWMLLSKAVFFRPTLDKTFPIK